MVTPMSPRVHCLIHPKTGFTPKRAGAFSLNVYQASMVSRYRDAITVFGAPVAEPFEGLAFAPVKSILPALFGKNMGFARGYARQVKNDPPEIIEVFNRPVIGNWLSKTFPGSAVTVYFGNDPQEMLGSRTVAQRQNLIDRLARVYCVSHFIRDRFVEGLTRGQERCVVLYTGMPVQPPTPKEPIVVLAGRMVPEKGALELVGALLRVLPRHPQWSAHLIGAKWFVSGETLTEFEQSVASAAAASDRIKLLGFLPNDETMANYRRAAIAAVPSNWDDPFPRTGVEALSAGCALICSRRGGLAELGDRAHFIDAVTVDHLEAALEKVISDDTYRLQLQQKAVADFPFALADTAAAWDDQRQAILRQSGG